MQIDFSKIFSDATATLLSTLIISIGVGIIKLVKFLFKKWKERRKQNNFNVEDAIW